MAWVWKLGSMKETGLYKNSFLPCLASLFYIWRFTIYLHFFEVSSTLFLGFNFTRFAFFLVSEVFDVDFRMLDEVWLSYIEFKAVRSIFRYSSSWCSNSSFSLFNCWRREKIYSSFRACLLIGFFFIYFFLGSTLMRAGRVGCMGT